MNIEKQKTDFATIAKANVEVEVVRNSVYVLGSEKAIKKIFRKCSEFKDAHRGYSQNLKRHFFVYDLPEDAA